MTKEITVKRKKGISKVYETNELGAVITRWKGKKFISITFNYAEKRGFELSKPCLKEYKDNHYEVLSMWLEQGGLN